METLIGFAVGFIVGTREGKDGVARLRESLNAILGSADVKRFVGDAAAALGPVMREMARATGGA